MLTPKSIQEKIYGLKKIGMSICAIAIIAIVCTNCANKNSPNNATGNESSSTSIPENAREAKPLETLIFVSIPAGKKKNLEASQKLLTEYLQEKLQHKVDFKIAKDYDAAIDMLVTGEAQMGILGPFSYIKAKQRNPKIEPIAAAIYELTQRPWYTSTILTRPETNIKTLADLKGKKFSFVSRSSTSGFLVPSYAFKQEQIVPETDFSEVLYSGNHDQSIIDLIARKIDAVSVESTAIYRAKQEGVLTDGNYIKIWESDPITESPFVVNEKFPSELVDTLKNAIINAEGFANDSGMRSMGFTIVTDRDYELIRQVHKEVLSPSQ